MIKKIIHLSDIHIRNVKRHDEYYDMLQKFVSSTREIVSEFTSDEVRILVCGDLLHQKITTSNEQSIMLSWFFRELNSICKTIVICGNHDFLENNQDRVDSITPIIKMLELPNVKYLDMELSYKSGLYEDENIIWCLYSIFDGYNSPEVQISKVNNPDKTHIGLFHGAIAGSTTDSTYMIESGLKMDIFAGCDVVLCGDIHKRSELDYNGIKVVYPGSLIQQDFGENVSRHGFLLWDVDELEYEEFDIENNYGYYKFSIDSISDIDNGNEQFINF
jgi:DNA repair exonuclease SbcCD nuclease subunit